MPIIIPDSLPARQVLESENVFVMTEVRGMHQDIRPLHLLVLNLMPTKITTETQLLRKLSNTPLQIHLHFLRTSTHTSQNTSHTHLSSFYQVFDDVKDHKYDGLIVTGAPIENLPFEEVDYWEELCEILQWSKTNVHSVLHICWGAQAGLYYHYNIPKYPLDAKAFGVFSHTVHRKSSPLFRGFDDFFQAPHSRHTEVRVEDVQNCPHLKLLATSDEVGLFAAKSEDNHDLFLMGHLEYDPETLSLEYFRDVERGLKIDVPKHYFEGDNPENPPQISWRSAGQLLFNNWLNYYVYQTTPYLMDEI
ncbi:MAG: homoserine O-succinyltransferase [Eubacteriales bacterium]